MALASLAGPMTVLAAVSKRDFIPD